MLTNGSRVAILTNGSTQHQFTLVNTTGGDVRVDALAQEVQMRDGESLIITQSGATFYGPQRALDVVFLPVGDAFTGGAAPPAAGVLGVNEVPILAFDDTLGEGCSWVFRPPESWYGKNLKYIEPVFLTAATQSANNVRWQVVMQGSGAANFTGAAAIAENFDVSGGATATEVLSPEFGLVTGLAIARTQEYFTILFKRNAGSVFDTVVGDANLIGITLRAV